MNTHCRHIKWSLTAAGINALLLAAVFGVTGCSSSHTDPSSQAKTHQSRPGKHLTALDEYVQAPDTNYEFHLVRTAKGRGETTSILEMTSQQWLTTNEVDRPIWKHWVNIIRPDEVTSSKALLFISGGHNGGNPPDGADRNLVQAALATKSIVIELKMIPNQPLVFKGETQGRSEDEIIAYCWDKYLRSGEAKWLPRLPMTKAAVRAMDTAIAFCGTPEGGNVKLDGFVVAGGSKRGWTTWTTAAVDQRVVAIVPIVIDMLNVEPSFLHHYAAYGFWAPAVGDYEAFHIMEWTGTPQYHAMMQIVEPYSYRQRYTMPKFLINASGDQFFLPDSAQFYFKDLPAVKYLRYVPNADHSLKGSDALQSLIAFYNAILYHEPLPHLSWTAEKPGTMRVVSQDKPTEVKLWQATNPNARDFRLETLGPQWHSSELQPQQGDAGVYLAQVPAPPKGWTAYFVELTYPSKGPVPFKFTTEVRVVPDVLPYKFVPPAKPGQWSGAR